jgi:enoyl-[acyl-carrier-protein] reductase (NADH)
VAIERGFARAKHVLRRRRDAKHAKSRSLILCDLCAYEVAKVVVFICSPEAAAITGAAIRADGGVIRAAM